MAVVTDSASCIPRELREQYNIAVVPLGFLFGETLYLDDVSLSWGEFYTLLKEARRLPTTAAPPPGDFLQAFTQAYQRGFREILCIVTSAGFTGTYAAACEGAQLARQDLADATIRVMDSHSAAASLGFVVLEAARAAAAGASLDEAAAKAETLTDRLYMLGLLDSLEYPARGGRVPALAHWLQALVRVKPLFQLHDSKLRFLGAARTKPRGIARLVVLARQRVTPQRPLHVAVFHTRALEEAQELAARVRRALQPAELYVTEFSQVMSIHSGPGLVGLAFYNEP